MIRRLAGGRVFTDYADEAWHVSLFRITLIAAMAGSAATGPVVIRYGLGASWAGYLLPFAVLCGAAGALTTGLLGRPAWRDRRGLMFRLGEVVLLVLLARILAWIFSEGLPGLSNVRDWIFTPGSFFTGEFLFAVTTLLLSWGLAVAAAADFRELAIQPDEMAARESREWGDSKSQWRAGNPRARTDILQGFALRWMSIGAALVVCAGLTRVNVSVSQGGQVRIGLRGLGLRPEVVVGLVAYFLSGLILMTHGRLAVLRARWYNQEVDIAPSLMRRWHASSLLFVLLVALVALLLPLGTTGWLAQALEWIIALVARIVMALVFVVSLLFALLARLLEALFGQAQPPPPEPTPTPVPPQTVPTQAEMVDQLPPWLGGATLWLVVAAVTLLLLINFARTSGLLEARLGPQLTRWRLWWRARRARLDEQLAKRIKRLAIPFRRARRARNAPASVRSSGEVSRLPRDEVRRYYMAALQEAAQEGAPRRASQTPSEFARDLADNWPESEQDIEGLTGAFLDARYSAREIGETDVTGARGAWQRLAAGFRRPRPKSEDSR